jgi:hypothetical protein
VQAAGVVAPSGSPVPGTGAPTAGGSADQLVGQVSGASVSGGVASVSSTLLTSGQEKFVAKLASLTGLDPKVLSAWCLSEESSGAAQGREAAGNFNWLNIGYFDSGAGAIAFNQQFGNPVSAAEQTARFLQGTWGGASTGIQHILNSVGHSPDQQIMAIANSGWASTGYHGGADIRGTYGELGDLQVTRA